MIKYDTEAIFGLIFKLKGSVLIKVWKPMLINMAIGFVAIFLKQLMDDRFPFDDMQAWSTLGTVLGFLLVFRSNLCYSRYWEGRNHMGLMLKSTRELLRQVVSYTEDVPGTPDEDEEKLRRDIARMIVLLFNMVKDGLRGDENLEDYVQRDMMTVSEKSRLEDLDKTNPKSKGSRPSIVATWISQKLFWLCRKGGIHVSVLKKMDGNLGDIITAWMGAQKIVTTPMVFPYAQMISVFLTIFVFTVPFPLANYLALTTTKKFELPSFIICPAISGLIAYAYFGINAVGIEIEDPFGKDDNDLDLDGMAKQAEVDAANIISQYEYAIPIDDGLPAPAEKPKALPPLNNVPQHSSQANP